MTPALSLRSIALLVGLCSPFGFAPSVLAEPIDPPIALGSIDTPGIASRVEVEGTLAYVADGTWGLRVIDSIAIPEPGALLLQLAAASALLGLRARRRPRALASKRPQWLQ